MVNLTLTMIPHKLAVCRLTPEQLDPADFTQSAWWSVTRTADELSIVLPEADVRPEWQAETDWRGLKVEGPLDFSLVGILANLSQILADAHVSIFAISTYDTDYILVKAEKVEAAVVALTAAGHTINRSEK